MNTCKVREHEDENILGLCSLPQFFDAPLFCYCCQIDRHGTYKNKCCLRFDKIKEKINTTYQILQQQQKNLEERFSAIENLKFNAQRKTKDCLELLSILEKKDYYNVSQKLNYFLYYYFIGQEKMRQEFDKLIEKCALYQDQLEQIIIEDLKRQEQIQQLLNGNKPLDINYLESIQNTNYVQNSISQDQKIQQLQNHDQQQLQQRAVQQQDVSHQEKNIFQTPTQNAESQYLQQTNDEDENDLAIYNMILKESQEEYNQLLQQKSDDYLNQAKNTQNKNQALTLLDKAIEIYDHNEEAYYWKSNILYQLEKFNQSIECIQELLKINSQHQYAHITLAFNLTKLNKYDEAEEAYKIAIFRNPTISTLYSNRAFNVFQQGKYQDAINYCNQALALDKSDGSAYNNKAMALQQLNDFQDALNNYNLSIQYEPNALDVWANKGVLLLKMGRIDEASNCLNYIEQRSSSSSIATQQLKIQMLLTQGKNQEALQLCKYSLQIYPNNVVLLNQKYEIELIMK